MGETSKAIAKTGANMAIKAGLSAIPGVGSVAAFAAPFITNKLFGGGDEEAHQPTMAEQFQNAQMQYAMNDLAYKSALLPTKYDMIGTYMDHSNERLGPALNKMPEYSQITLDSPETQNIYNILNKMTQEQSKQAFGGEFNTSAKNKEFGSSYQAARQGAIEKDYAQQDANNLFKAYDTANSMWNNNFDNGMKTTGFYMNSIPASLETAAGNAGTFSTSLINSANNRAISTQNSNNQLMQSSIQALASNPELTQALISAL